jgi:hypothetical protein
MLLLSNDCVCDVPGLFGWSMIIRDWLGRYGTGSDGTQIISEGLTD